MGSPSDRFTIQVEGHAPLEEAWTLAEARDNLKGLLRSELDTARKKWGVAFLHRGTPDTGRITASQDKQSPLWCAAGIVPA